VLCMRSQCTANAQSVHLAPSPILRHLQALLVVTGAQGNAGCTGGQEDTCAATTYGVV
jgi:hypothetical protein